jgi:signal transduction histidine kinase/ActR/RegA family two-component response regulator
LALLDETASRHALPPSRVASYGVAVLAVAAAAALRVPLLPVLGDSNPFTLFYPAVMLAGWVGGVGPGLLATVLSTLAAWYFFIPPAFSFRLARGSDYVQLFLYFLVGLVITWLNETRHRGLRRIAAAHRTERQQRESARCGERERDRLLAMAEAARRDAETASRSKDEFLASVSHELRTPLNAMMGWAQLLQLTRGDEQKLDRGLAIIVRNAKLQAQLIDDLLDISRIISGKMRLDVRQVDLIDVIDGALEAVRPAVEAKQIRLQRLLDPLAAPVAGDADRLRQVVWNLLANAVKFTPRDGRIEVRLERVNSHVEILVADTGAGIAPEFLPHVFDRFRQYDGSITRQQGGLGLGLSIVRHLVELHGGAVRVKSPGLGQGATFAVTLPVAIAQIDAADGERVHPRAVSPQPPEDEAAIALNGIRVLVVDDEPDARETIRHVLEHCQAEVLAVGSAAEALSELPRFAPDVLLSDIGMPGEDGYSLIHQVRKLPPEQGGRIPAVALTAYARSQDRRRTLIAGFQMHVAKPVEIQELAAVVSSLARTRR